MTRSAWQPFLRAISWLLFGIAGFSFLLGGMVISDVGKIDRTIAELLGFLIAAATGVAGYMLKSAADDLIGPSDHELSE